MSKLQYLIGSAAALLAVGAFSIASAAPTQGEIDKARAECAAHKQKVAELEARRAGDPALSNERALWEKACARANRLMDERDGKQTPQPVSETLDRG
ncbi:MAG: hypothetical protein ACRETN_02515 [Nevskiales bacterium]